MNDNLRPDDTPTDTARPSTTRVAFATGAGSLVEWFDFFIYGTAAALVFPKVFFPDLSPIMGTLVAFASFAAGFFFRPIGAAVFGHFGDRIGRKNTLIFSLTVMGVATTAIGVIPPSTAIGVAAPLLLIFARVLQGFAVGGEFGGAVLMAVEHAPDRKRGFYGSFPNITVPIALILSSLSFVALTGILSADQFEAWGWRIPFLSSPILVLVGLYIRLNLAESPTFKRLLETGGIVKAPLKAVIRQDWRTMVRVALSYPAPGITFYMVSLFAVAYGVDSGLAQGQMLSITLVSALAMAVMVPLGAIIADRIGGKPVYMTGLVVIGVSIVPTFLLIGTGNFYMATIGMLLPSFGYGVCFGPLGALFADNFPPETRYTGLGTSFNLASAIGSSTAPMVATALYAATGDAVAVGLYVVGWVLLSVLVTKGLKETLPAPRVRYPHDTSTAYSEGTRNAS